MLALLLAGLAHASMPLREGLLTLPSGERVGLLHLPGQLPGGAPVLLVPDLGLTPLVYLDQGRGLAATLAAAGREVYILDWSRTDTHGGLEGIVGRILPAALRAAGDGGPVDVVGHGYAGSLVIAASTHEAEGLVGRMVALSTPVELAPPSPVLTGMLEGGGRLADLALTPGGTRTLDLLLMDGGTLSSGLRSRLRRVGVLNLESRVATDLLTWMRSGELQLPDAPLVERLRRYDRPTLLLLPLRDNFAHQEHAAPLRELAPRARVRSQQLSRLDGLAEDYTHVSILQGRHAPAEVWPHILRHLRGPALQVEEVGP
ncbi:MAG TPA: hypothetical protein VK013_02425 [Myxococcaceae bacterium]|nr:hypothetical protein [Myxococcaceae bacterium]